jgi:hypothetical protein
VDAPLNRPNPAKFRIVDSNGSPVTSGVTGTISLFGPASTTALVSGTALSHLGDGNWGAIFAASNFGTPGTYRWQTSAITGTVTWSAQYGTFLVGPTDEWTLRELLVSVRRALRDGWTGTTDGIGTTTTLKASAFAYGSANDWVSSEIFILEPVTVTDTNPVRVTSFAVSGGTFTFTPAVTGIASTAVGIDFILGNKDGEGFSHDEVLDAILTAIRRRRAPRRVRDQVLLTTTTGTYEYSVPANWLGVDAVEYQPWSGWPTDWQPIAQPYAPYSATTGILTLLVPPPNNALRITGRALPQLPALLTDLVPGDGAAIRDDAVFELLKMSDDPGDRQRAAMMQGGVERARAGAALARL